MRFRQGYRGWASIDDGNSGIYVLCRDPASANMARQIDAPAPYRTSSGPLNYAEGAAIPLVELPVVPQNAWWTVDALWSMLAARTWDGDDLAGRFRVTVANNSVDPLGKVAYTGAICAGYSIAFAKGEALSMTLRFMGIRQADPPDMPAPRFSTMGTYADVALGGVFAGRGIVGGRLDVDNNVAPIVQMNDEILWGAGPYLRPMPTEIVAGTPTARLSLQFHGNDLLDDTPYPGLINIGGVVWRVNALLNLTPFNNQHSMGRVVRSMTYQCMAGTPGGAVVDIY